MGGAPDFGLRERLRPFRHRVFRPARVIISVTLPLPLGEPAAHLTAGRAVRMVVAPRRFGARRLRRAEEGGRAWVLDVEIEMPEPDPEQLLAESEGYLVDSVGGRELGVVKEVQTHRRGGPVTALLVAGGWFGRRRFRVDADAVDALLPADRRIVVRESGVRPLDDDRSA
jgi:hypothetical protein